MAVGIIVAALGNGKKVPQDLNVVGFDDSPFARAMWPTITSLAQPVDEMAHLSTQKLIEWVHAEALTNRALNSPPKSSFAKAARKSFRPLLQREKHFHRPFDNVVILALFWRSFFGIGDCRGRVRACRTF